ncbi:hypothetical protein ACFYZB_29800 [Streptomyces sp. NPDC001852]|uniref:hypothetical protein n=1 Tax=Streptomyces sp. NPDC001852 TaxID=3364619 RepID=UPI00369F6E56
MPRRPWTSCGAWPAALPDREGFGRAAAEEAEALVVVCGRPGEGRADARSGGRRPDTDASAPVPQALGRQVFDPRHGRVSPLSVADVRRHRVPLSRINHSVIVASVPRPWFEEAVVVLFDVVRGTRAEEGQVLLPDGRAVPGVRLVEGEHLAAGAVYEVEAGEGPSQEPERLRIVDRRTGSDPAARREYAPGDEGTVTVVEGVLHAVARRVGAELHGSVRTLGRRWASLRRAQGSARVDLRAWWDAAAGRRFSGTPFEARLGHRLAEAALWAVPRPQGDNAVRAQPPHRTGRLDLATEGRV